MRTVSELLTIIDAFLAASPLRETQLSARLFDDSKKIAALRSGADLVTARFNAACDWLSVNWPDAVAWPSGIARPAPLAEADDSVPAAECAVPFLMPECAP